MNAITEPDELDDRLPELHRRLDDVAEEVAGEPEPLADDVEQLPPEVERRLDDPLDRIEAPGGDLADEVRERGAEAEGRLGDLPCERRGSVRDVFRDLDEGVSDLDESLHDGVEHRGRRVLDRVDQLGDRLPDRAERSNDARHDACREARRLLEQLPDRASELEECPHHVLQQGGSRLERLVDQVADRLADRDQCLRELLHGRVDLRRHPGEQLAELVAELVDCTEHRLERCTDEVCDVVQHLEHRASRVDDSLDDLLHERQRVGHGSLERALDDVEDRLARGQQRLGQVRHLGHREVDRRDERLRDRLERVLDRVDDRVHGLLDRVHDVLDQLDDRGVVRVVLDRARLDRRAQIREVQEHLAEGLAVLFAGFCQHEVLHQRSALGGGKLADRVHDPAILVGLPVAVDQGAPLLGRAQRDCLEELAMVVDVGKRLGQSSRDPQPLGARCSVCRLVERADFGGVRLRRSDAELQFLGAELGERSDLRELPGC